MSPASASHDKPAIVLSSILGIAAILASVFFLPRFYCESPSATSCTTSANGSLAFDVLWAKQEADGAKTQTFVQSADLSIQASGVQAGTRVTILGCNDNAVPNLQPQATITYTISNGTRLSDPVSFTCATQSAGNSETSGKAPDIATADGSSKDDARTSLLADPRVHSGLVTYTLHLTVARTGGLPNPTGLGAPTLAVNLKFAALKFEPTLTPHAVEVAK